MQRERLTNNEYQDNYISKKKINRNEPGKQTDYQTNRQVDKQADRKQDKWTNRQTDRQPDQ